MNRTSRRPLACVVSTLFLLLGLAACGSGSGSSDEPAQSTTSGDADSATALQTSYDGFLGQPPTASVQSSEPVEAWIVSCGQSLPTCSDSANGIVEAAQAIGWDETLCDGKLNPEGWASCIRQGIANKPDVLLINGQDCSSFEGPLQEAKDAGIVTIGVGNNDCDISGGSKLFTAVTQRFEAMTSEEWWVKIGELQGAWLIGKTGGKVDLLEVTFADAAFGPWISEGLHRALDACEGCTISHTLQLTNADANGGTIEQKFSAALLKAPEVNAVAVPLDPWFLAGISQAIVSSGRSEQLAVIGAFGQQGSLDLIRAGLGQDATVAFNLAWDGWVGVDTAARILAGQEPLPAGLGAQVVDASTNLPAAEASFDYEPPIDFKSLYRQAWGLE